MRSLLSLAAVLLFTSAGWSCPFCTSQGRTLLEEAGQANFILFGTLSNAQRDPSEFGKGTTDMTVELVVKEHAILKERKVITLPRYFPVDPKGQTKHLVFMEVYNGQIDPYRGVAVDGDSKVGEYIKGALAMREKDVATRLGFFFKYLDSSEAVVANDAYVEFGNSDYKDYRPLAEKLDAAKVIAWLKDPNTPASRFGLYGSMLGHCGKKEDAAIVRALLDDPKKRFSSGIDGILAGYVMLDRKEGWQYLCDMLKNEKNEFLLRYAGLRAVRFFWEYRQDVVDKKQILEAMDLLLDHPDIADFPMDDLRRWGQWQFTDRVLSMATRPSHNVPIVKRAIIRFALCAPAEYKQAGEFIARMRKEDADKVRDIEELLQLENTPPKKDAAATKPVPKVAMP